MTICSLAWWVDASRFARSCLSQLFGETVEAFLLNSASLSMFFFGFIQRAIWGFFFLYYKGFHYTFSSSCNPNLPVLSQTNHSRSGLCSYLLKDVEIWKGDFSQLLILPWGCLWGSTKGFFGMYFRLLRELKRDLCICSIEEKLLP